MMEINGKNQKKAYLRENEHAGQCDLTFFLKTEVPEKNVELCKLVIAVRQSSDTVASMINHIKNKLQKTINDILNQSSDASSEQTEYKEIIDIPVRLMRSGRDIREDILLKNLLKSQDPIILEVFSQKYVILCNSPLVKSIKFVSVFYVGFKIQPIKFVSLYTNREKSIFRWSKSLDKIEWSICGSGYSYLPTSEDVGYYLKLTCVPINEENVEGPTFEAISDAKVEVMEDIPMCPFQARHEFTKKGLSGSEYRVVSYNILAERYTTIDGNYSYCSPKYIVFDYRKQLLCKELSGFNADIICLQEVDSFHYHSFWKTKIREWNFNSIYHKKGNSIPEGLACFYKKTRFRILESDQIVFSEVISKWKIFRSIWELVKKNADVKAEFMKVSTSLQVSIFEMKGYNNRLLLVANTHLYYHPDADHIRLLQACMATAYIKMLTRNYPRFNVSVIFCGDFNSNPKTSLFPFMTEGKINPRHEDCLKISPSGTAVLHHELFLNSACETSKHTNYTPDYKGCLDYIFVDSRKFSVQRIVPLPNDEELSEYDGLPNKYFPSDHLPLVVDLKFKPN